MFKVGVAKLFRNGRSQAVRLPREFRFEGDRVRIRRVPQGVLLQPLISDTRKWFEELDQFASEPVIPPQGAPNCRDGFRKIQWNGKDNLGYRRITSFSLFKFHRGRDLLAIPQNLHLDHVAYLAASQNIREVVQILDRSVVELH